MPASVRLAGEEFKTQKELNHRFFAIASYYAPCHWDTNSVSGEEDLTFLHAAMLYHPDIDFDPYQDSFRVDFNSHMSLSIYVDGGISIMESSRVTSSENSAMAWWFEKFR